MTESPQPPNRDTPTNASVSQLFASALEISQPDRVRWLEARCGDQVALKEKVLALLEAHRDAGGFLRTTEIVAPLEPPNPAANATSPPDLLDGYRLQSPLGEGGFGIVYLAEQQAPVRRMVAIKIIKYGMSSPEALARFEVERQALALMDHPCIATVLDAGQTKDGRPYFVMEWVQGVPITDYCAKTKLPVNDRLQLLQRVCGAIQHAHQKGVIHRDIKPSNILVAEVEGAPVPKVIDFGIAKAFREPIIPGPIETRVEQVIGTPAYMSPEQTGMPGGDADTRTDVYALGVLLYELLAGALPFESDDWQSVGFDEALRRIREDTPAKPSARLTTSSPQHRATIAGDLDIIALKALEKERSRRYETPNALAKDLDRFLKNEEIEARTPSLQYRALQFFRRHRLSCLATGISALSVIVGLTISLFALAEALSEKERADQQAVRTQKLIYPTLLEAAHEAIDNGLKERARELLTSSPRSERGWEWAWAQRALTSPSHIFRFPEADPSLAQLQPPTPPNLLRGFLPGGTELHWDWEAPNDAPKRRASAFEGLINEKEIVTTAFSAHSKAPQWMGYVTAEGVISMTSNQTPRRTITMEGRVYDAVQMTLNETSERVAVSALSGVLHVWNFQGAEVWRSEPTGVAKTSLAYSKDGTLLASGTENGSVLILRAEDGRELHTLNGHRRAVTQIAFEETNNTVASGGEAGGIALWDSVSGRRLGSLLGDGHAVTALAFGSPAHHIVAATAANAVYAWDLRSLRSPIQLVGSTDMVYECALANETPWLVTGARDGSLRIWDRHTGAERVRYNPRCAIVYSVDINAQGDRIASRGDDAVLRLWSPTATEPIWEQTIDPRIRVVRFSPDGTYLATGSPSGDTAHRVVALWDVRRRTMVQELAGSPHDLVDLAFDPTGKRIAGISRENNGSDRGRILIWDISSGAILHDLSLPDGVAATSVLWGRRSKTIYSGHLDGRIAYWNADTGALERTVYAHGDPVGSLALAPDGLGLLSGSWYGAELRLWDPHTGEPRYRWDGGIPGVSDVAFDAQGGLAACGADGLAYYYPPTTAQSLAFPEARGLEHEAHQLLFDEVDLASGGAGFGGFRDAIQRLAEARMRHWESAQTHDEETTGPQAFAAAALDRVAYEYFLSHLFEEASETLKRAQALWPTSSREEQLHWVDIAWAIDAGYEYSPASEQLEPHVGEYGPWEIEWEEDRLSFTNQRTGLSWPLLPVEPFTFLMIGDEGAQLRFLPRDAGQAATPAMEVLRFQGGRTRRERTH